jgi:hypothetical protein
MGPIFDRLFVGVVLGGIIVWVVWGWVSWRRNRPKHLSLGIACSLVGFTLGSISAAMQVGSGLYAQFTDGFPFMDPRLLRIYGFGMVSAFVGLICGVFGADSKNPFRWKGHVLCIFLLLLWLAEAVGE